MNMQNILSVFASDYLHARQLFLDAAEPYKLGLQSFSHPLTGRNNEELATDVLWLGEADAEMVLVLLSATHGVEGFCGSAAQVDFLRHYTTLPEGVAVLLVHAVNPHGFSFLRRVTEGGVDLNRNYVDFNLPLPSNPEYEALADAIVPRSLDTDELVQADATLEKYRQKFGDVVYEKALSAGQYTHPQGLFYGGTGPCWSRQVCEHIIDEYQLASRKRVAVIDFHTGLGPFGYGEAICDHPPGLEAVQLARAWYGDSVTEPALGTSTSVAKFGLSDEGWINKIGAPLVFIALEFGTYSFDNMKEVLRADHWLHAQEQMDWLSPQTQAIKAGIRRHFYPDTDEWKTMVLVHARQCIAQALQGLSSEAHHSI